MTTSALEPAALQYELVFPPERKPSSQQLRDSHARFYGSLAAGFDEFNAKSTRGLYFESIDRAIAAALEQRNSRGKLLSIGAGTGFREVRIQELSKLPLQITCIDISAEMCRQASARGLETFCGTLLEAPLTAESFQACIFLNAFETLTDFTERLSYLRQIASLLKPGAPLFVDALDINDENDSWAGLVKNQFHEHHLHTRGYDLGDCFSRRTDQQETVFAHYSSQPEMEQLFAAANLKVCSLQFFSEETGGPCEEHKGNMFYTVEKK